MWHIFITSALVKPIKAMDDQFCFQCTAIARDWPPTGLRELTSGRPLRSMPASQCEATFGVIHAAHGVVWQVRDAIARQAADAAAQLAAQREAFDGGGLPMPATLPELADELAALSAGRRFVRSMQVRNGGKRTCPLSVRKLLSNA